MPTVLLLLAMADISAKRGTGSGSETRGDGEHPGVARPPLAARPLYISLSLYPDQAALISD